MNPTNEQELDVNKTSEIVQVDSGDVNSFDEKLEEILEDFGMSCARQSVVTLEDVNEAKQSITSLIKELVAEAKQQKSSSNK